MKQDIPSIAVQIIDFLRLDLLWPSLGSAGTALRLFCTCFVVMIMQCLMWSIFEGDMSVMLALCVCWCHYRML